MIFLKIRSAPENTVIDQNPSSNETVSRVELLT